MNLFVTASTCVWSFGRLELASRTKSWSAWCSGNPKFWPSHTHPLCPSIPRNCTIVILEWLKNLYEGILTLLISISTALKLYFTNEYSFCLQNQENFEPINIFWESARSWILRQDIMDWETSQKEFRKVASGSELYLWWQGASQLIAPARNLRCWTKIDVKTWVQRILIAGLQRTSWSPLRTTSPSWYGCTWLTVMINNDQGENGKFCNIFLYLRQTDTS